MALKRIYGQGLSVSFGEERPAITHGRFIRDGAPWSDHLVDLRIDIDRAFLRLETVVAAISGGIGTFKGDWDASANSPTLVSGVGVAGDYYRVSISGTTTLDGISVWDPPDWAIFNGVAWLKVDNSEVVASVNTQTGAVVLDTDDISEGSTNLYYTEIRVSANTDVFANSTHSGITSGNPHGVDFTNLGSGTFSQLDTLITDATLMKVGDAPAAHAGSHVGGGTDQIDGDRLDIDFTPSNYSPDATPAEATTTDDLAAHLKGIDTKLAARTYTVILGDISANVPDGTALRWGGERVLSTDSPVILPFNVLRVTWAISQSSSGPNDVKFDIDNLTDVTTVQIASGAGKNRAAGSFSPTGWDLEDALTVEVVAPTIPERPDMPVVSLTFEESV